MKGWAGDQWAEITTSQIADADIMILLVSPDLISSEYFWNVELNLMRDITRNKKGSILPIITRPCDWQITPLGKFLVMPAGGLQVSEAEDTDSIWIDVSNQIARIAADWRASL